MTYEELFNYLKDDFIPLCKLQAPIAKVRFHNKVTIYGYEFTPEEFTKFEEYFKNYYHNFESKEKFDNIVNIIYAQYRKEVEEKEKMTYLNRYIEHLKNMALKILNGIF